eukprot:TRINITY_DN6865_c0_g1_i1.p1 TRINITY_DN6865_c0_g1~~TRINITY_DN6865_c0_g1_i1.p1  ORF type:complete len:613 (-),score=175.86 TRINITY_DN6865_c0_g1_i1:59-1897(-)
MSGNTWQRDTEESGGSWIFPALIAIGSLALIIKKKDLLLSLFNDGSSKELEKVRTELDSLKKTLASHQEALRTSKLNETELIRVRREVEENKSLIASLQLVIDASQKSAHQAKQKMEEMKREQERSQQATDSSRLERKALQDAVDEANRTQKELRKRTKDLEVELQSRHVQITALEDTNRDLLHKIQELSAQLDAQTTKLTSQEENLLSSDGDLRSQLQDNGPPSQMRSMSPLSHLEKSLDLPSIKEPPTDPVSSDSPSFKLDDVGDISDLDFSKFQASMDGKMSSRMKKNLKSPSRRDSAKVPSFMSVFQTPATPDMSRVSPPPTRPRDTLQLEWLPGSQIIKEYAMTEDINKRGMRKKKNIMTGGKGEMEDQHLVMNPFSESNDAMFGVFDGHAGKDCAIAAVKKFSTIFKLKLEAYKSSNGNMCNLEQVFLDTYEQVDKELIEYEYMGCTATTAYLWEANGHRYLQVANVGDSTSFLNRGHTVVTMSVDHKPTNPSERERILASGIELNANATRLGGLAVSRALGDHFLKIENLGLTGVPYVSPPIQLEANDSILIVASDGLWDVMNGSRAVEICTGLDTAKQMAASLMQTALNDPKCNDNITIVVVKL